MSFIKKPKTIENIQKLEKAQQHISDHRDVYLAAAGGIMVGILVTRLFTRNSTTLNVNISTTSK